MRVYVDPIPTLGIAMRRTAQALKATAPDWVEIVDDPASADLQVLHAVDLHVRQHLVAPRYAVMMHCLDYVADPAGTGDNLPITSAPGVEPWAEVWQDATVVWSYYNLARRPFQWEGRSDHLGTAIPSGERTAPHFYYAPLGVDGATFVKTQVGNRPVACVTTGYVSGPRAEAIEEVALAAAHGNWQVRHLGPSQVGGMTARVPGWSAVSGISDAELVALYNSTRYVSGLRHGEGFELPVIEGLACGARPICFDLPCYRAWFDKYAAFVPPSHGGPLVDRLIEVLQRPPRPVLPEERRALLQQFHWPSIAVGFWRAISLALPQTRPARGTSAAPDPEAAFVAHAAARTLAATPPPEPRLTVSDHVSAADGPPATRPVRPRIVWLGDSPTTDWTGFGRASKQILARLAQDFEIAAIGTTHNGDPYDWHEIPYPVYPLSSGVANIITKVRPHLVVIQHDPWQVATFMRQAGNVPTVGVMPIDGKNCRTDYLNGLRLAIWWTEFGLQEARDGGYAGPSTIIPLGVDQTIYRPLDRVQARRSLGLRAEMDTAFLVGYVARNQPRKRMDLAVHHFAEWVKRHEVHDAYLYLQTAPTGEAAYDISELMRYEGLSNRLILHEQAFGKHIPEAAMAGVYNALDVFWSTTQGEGFGLPALEAMACGVPCVLPDWSAYGDWAKPAAHLVPCSDVSGTINSARPQSGVKVAIYGAVPDRLADIAALDKLYRDVEYRASLRAKSLALASEARFRWAAIGEAYAEVLKRALSGPVLLR